jgi:hypothetical protein
MPPEIGLLNEQQFAVKTRVCGGIGCPNDRFDPYTCEGPYVPFDELTCFCVDIWLTGHFIGEVTGWGSVDCGEEYYIIPKVNDIEIVDITPDGLESGLECYMMTVFRTFILRQVEVALRSLSLEIAGLCVSLCPTSRTVPYNPAIENDRLKVYINIR